MTKKEINDSSLAYKFIVILPLVLSKLKIELIFRENKYNSLSYFIYFWLSYFDYWEMFKKKKKLYYYNTKPNTKEFLFGDRFHI